MSVKLWNNHTSTVILPGGKGRATVILNHEDYLEEFMKHINNGPYELFEKSPTTKSKLRQRNSERL